MVSISLSRLLMFTQGVDIRFCSNLLSLGIALGGQSFGFSAALCLQALNGRLSLCLDLLDLCLGASFHKLCLAHSLCRQHSIHDLLKIARKDKIFDVRTVNGHTIGAG